MKPETLLREVLRESLTLPPPVNVWQWAELRRRMGKDVTAKPGRYRVATAPYQREPQEAFTAPDVQATVLCFASRLGKTEIENNLIGSKVEIDPCNILFVWPTLDRARVFSKQFLVPMILGTPVLKDLISTRQRKGDNTILGKSFPGGNISLIGSNSPSGFRGIQAPVVICDEVDAMENCPEGDPITLAFKRAENYPDSIQVVSSTPTFKGASRIWDWLERSDYRQWFCPCPACGTYQVLKWEQVEFDDNAPELAFLRCANAECKAALNDAQRVEMVLRGEWRATQPFHGIRGYWLNGLNTTFEAKKGYYGKLHQMAAEHIDAKTQGEEAMIVWTNTFKCEPHEVVAETSNPHELMERCETYPAEVPRGAVVLVAGADVQSDRIEVEVLAAGEGEETWAVDYAVFQGKTDEDAVWQDLDAYLAREWLHESGAKLRVAMTFIDMGHNSKNVYAFTRPRESRRIYAVKGASDRFAPLVSHKATRNNAGRAPLFIVGTHVAKNTIFYRLKVARQAPGPCPRLMHWPIANCYDQTYFEQFTAEHLIAKKLNGQIVKCWELREGQIRNEALDVRVYAIAALEKLRPNWKALRARVDALSVQSRNNTPQAAQPAPVVQPALTPAQPNNPAPGPAVQPAAPARTRRPRREESGRSRFISGWRR